MSSTLSLSGLRDALDAAAHEARLTIYSESAVFVTAEELDAGRPLRGWFALRLDAGPPGHDLPKCDAASVRLHDASATLADAASLWLTPGALSSDETALLRHLERYIELAIKFGASSSLRELVTQYMVLRARTGAVRDGLQRLEELQLAEHAAEESERARSFLRPLAEDPALRDMPWIRVAAAAAWSMFDVPAADMCAPRLADLLQVAAGIDPSPALERLRAIDHSLGVVLDRVVDDLVGAHAREVLVDDPTVLAIVRAAWMDAPRCDSTSPLPAELPAWAMAMLRVGEVKAARLAALLLHDAGRLSSEELVPYLLLATRRGDLEHLAEHAPTGDVRELCDDFNQSLRGIPDDLADAVVSIALGHDGPRALQTCFLQRDVLAAALPTMRPHMRREVESLLQLLQTIAEERAVAEPAWTRLVARAHALDLADPRTLEARIASESSEPLPLALLELAAERTSELGPRDALRVASLLLAWLSGREHAEIYQAVFSEALLHAILAAEEVALWSRAASLVEWLLEHGGARHTRAELLYYRAKLAPAATEQRPDERKRVLKDLARAIILARRSGAGWCEVKASCQWVTRVLMALPTGPSRARVLARANAVLDAAESAALAWEMVPELWAERARLRLLDGDPDGAAEALRHALAHTQADRHPTFQADLLSNLAQTLLFSRRPGHLDEALTAARQALQFLPIDSGPASTAFTRGILGLVLAQHPGDHVAEAIVLLEDSLHTPWRQLGLTNPSTLRLGLVHAYQRAGQLSEARHHLEVALCDFEDDVSGALDAVGRALELDHADGRDTALPLVERLAWQHAASPWSPTLELLRAISIDLRSAIAHASAYLAGQIPRHPVVDELLRSAIDRQVDSLPHALLEQYLESGMLETEHLHLRGKIFLALGRGEALRAELEQRLAGPQQADERATTLAFLLAVAPRKSPESRRALDELDLLLRSTNQPQLRAHLAAVLFELSEEDPSHLRRASEHAEACGWGNREVWRLRAAIRGRQMTATVLESSPRTVEVAVWFAQEIPLASHEVSEMRLAMVRQLLFPAALTHPAAIDLAQQFLDRLAGNEAMDLVNRLAWIRRQREAPDGTRPVITGRTAGATTSFDDVPGWLVDLVAGRDASPPHSFSIGEARGLIEALSIRPDRAGDLLIWLVEQAGQFLPELVQDIAEVPVRGGRGSIALRLRETLAALLAQRPLFALRKLEVLLLQGTLEWGDGTPYARSASALLAEARTPEQRAEGHFYKGIERLEAWQTAPETSHVQLDAARQHLASAAALAAAHALPQHLHFGILVSSGNAYRQGHEPNLPRALAFYSQAEAVGAVSEHEFARLCKVRADALLARRAGTDVVDALGLIEQALKIRRQGWLRAETLLSAHQAELAREDLARLDRLRRALACIVEAAECDDGVHAEMFLRLRLRLLDQILEVAPRDPGAHRMLDEIEAGNPDVAIIVKYVRLQRQLPAGVAADDPLMLDLASHTWGIHGQVRSNLAYSDKATPSPVPWAREQLQHLAPDGVAPTSPGLLAAYALLCAYLCGGDGGGDPRTAKAAAEAAVAAVAAVPRPAVQAMLLGELSRVFAPEDHWAHPLRDFKRAAQLCERALAIPDLPEVLHADLLGYLARATRYRTDGDVRGHLLRAEQLYEQVVALREQAGDLALARHTAGNLAELRAALQRGGTATARQAEIAALRQAIAGSETPQLVDRAALARELTLLGSDTPGDQGTALLAEGTELFASLPWDAMEAHLVDSAGNYRTICLAELAVRRGDVDGAISRWRSRLDAIDRERAPAAWAMAAHNLADLLLRVGGPIGAREALELCFAALAIRTPDQGLEHHWETAFQLGQTALALLDEPSHARPNLRLFELAVEAVRSGLVAASTLGGGERRFRAGVTLLRLSLHAPGIAQFVTLAEQAWTHISAGRVALLVDSRSAAIESAAALAVAEALADRLGEQGLVGVTNGCAYVLSDAAATRVLPWIVRAAGSAHRRLAARTRRPPSVSHAMWMAWLTALRGGDAGSIARELEKIQERVPDFLSGEPDLQGLAAWLQARTGAAAIVVVPGRRGLLAAVVDWHGGLRTRVARLTAPRPPCDEAALARSMTQVRYSDLYMAAGRWAEETVIRPLQRLAPAELRHLLWLPAGPLRMLSPAHVWPGVAVSLAADLCLRTWLPTISSRVALFIADPGERGLAIPDAPRLAAILAARAACVGPTRVRMSCGERWGRRLGGSVPDLVDGPADASALLCEVAESEIVLLMCHGCADGPDDAELQVIAADGRAESVTIQQMAADPRRIAGQTFVLLSCETGRTGAWLHQAGGIAGALLAAGARHVLAPLWPVYVPAAVEVGAAALAAIAADQDLAEMLVVMHHGLAASGDECSGAGFVLWTA